MKSFGVKPFPKPARNGVEISGEFSTRLNAVGTGPSVCGQWPAAAAPTAGTTPCQMSKSGSDTALRWSGQSSAPAAAGDPQRDANQVVDAEYRGGCVPGDVLRRAHVGLCDGVRSAVEVLEWV